MEYKVDDKVTIVNTKDMRILNIAGEQGTVIEVTKATIWTIFSSNRYDVRIEDSNIVCRLKEKYIKKV